MARTDTLPHFLTDVADAIRIKGGTSDPIQASSFDTAIENLPSGGNISDYFTSTVPANSNNQNRWRNIIKKIPPIANEGNCYYLFQNCPATEIDLSLINTENKSDLQRMFQYCSNVVSLDTSGFDVSSTTNFSEMFFGCSNLENLSLPDFTGASPTNISGMFGNCYKLTSLDLSTLDTSNVTSMTYLFSEDSQLMFLDIRNFDFSGVSGTASKYSQMFTSVPSSCEMIVKSQTEKDWILSIWPRFTNIKTVAEYEAE